MVRTRITYPSLAPWVNGSLLHRVQAVGSTTTFNNRDLFELGTQDVVDVIDDVPAVAVTINTNDYGDIFTMATLAGLNTSDFDVTATNSNANITVVSGTTEVAHFHGVRLLDFATGICSGETGVDIWTPIQEECDIGSVTNNIEFTQYLSRVYVNRIDLNYAVGAEATENYSAETDFKLWLLNDARHVTYEKFTFSGASSSVDLALDEGSAEVVATLSDGTVAFMKFDSDGLHAVRFNDASAGTVTLYPVYAGTVARVNAFVYDDTNNNLLLPTSVTTANGDSIEVIYAANAPGDESLNSGTRVVSSKYYEALDSTVAGGLSQGQIEAYIIDPNTTTDWDRALRLRSVAISATLTREQLQELGRLRAYDRPVTLPAPITVNVETTAADLKQWAIFAGKLSEFDADTLDDIDIFDLMAQKDSMLVVKLFRQTDEEAGGTGADRKVLTDNLLGQDYFNDGTVGTYAATVQAPPEQEFALKTIVVPDLSITEEAFNVNVGANGTQTFNFRGNNNLFILKGDVSFALVLQEPGFSKNSA